MTIPTIQDARRFGFIFDPDAQWLLPEVAQRARDASLQTYANTAIPAEFTQFIDPLVIEILTAPKSAKLLFKEVKKGNWETSHVKFRVDEQVGRSVAYSDNASGGVADVNSNWLTREQYRFQTGITYGELEMAVASAARLNIVSQKQRAAANVIDNDSNKFYLYGVAEKDIYGFLNDPNLSATSAVTAGGTTGKVGWAGKNTAEIYSDIINCFNQLVIQTKGLITGADSLKLALSPSSYVHLSKATDFNVTVLDMLKKYFTKLDIVQLSELRSPEGAEKAYIFADTVNSMPTGELAFSEKFKSHAVIRNASSFEQKFSSTTYGCLIYFPLAFCGITGMESSS
jgi:hypothetical protein